MALERAQPPPRIRRSIDVVRRSTNPAILTEAARQENAIASRVQSAILPGEVDVEGLAISAVMLPCEVVGGD